MNDFVRKFPDDHLSDTELKPSESSSLDFGYADANVPTQSNLLIIETGPKVELTRDWAAALDKVERAAHTIHDYQRKLFSIEQEAKSYFERVGDERRICHERIEALEVKLAEAEGRATRAEAEVRASKLKLWQLRNDNRDYLKRCESAEAELRQSSAYIQRIEDLLNGV